MVELAESNITSNLSASGHGSSISNPTMTKTLKLVSAGEKAYLWSKTVEKVLEHFEFEIEKRVIEKYYFKKQSADKIAYELGCGRRTVFYWIDNILLLAEQWAYKLGANY